MSNPTRLTVVETDLTPRAPHCPDWCMLGFDGPDALREAYGYTAHGGPGDDPLHSAIVGKVSVDGAVFGVLVDAIEDGDGVLSPELWLSDGVGMRPMSGRELARLVPELVQAYADMLSELVRTGGEYVPVMSPDDRRAELHVLPDPPAVLPVPED